jgi:hypothetical protein
MKFTPADCVRFADKMGDPGATSAVRHQVEARIGQECAVLPQKPGTAPTTEGGTATAVPPSSSLWPCGGCGARNRLRDLVCRHCGDAKP